MRRPGTAWFTRGARLSPPRPPRGWRTRFGKPRRPADPDPRQPSPISSSPRGAIVASGHGDVGVAMLIATRTRPRYVLVLVARGHSDRPSGWWWPALMCRTGAAGRAGGVAAYGRQGLERRRGCPGVTWWCRSAQEPSGPRADTGARPGGCGGRGSSGARLRTGRVSGAPVRHLDLLARVPQQQAGRRCAADRVGDLVRADVHFQAQVLPSDREAQPGQPVRQSRVERRPSPWSRKPPKPATSASHAPASEAMCRPSLLFFCRSSRSIRAAS